jgi:hypothetical protein
MDPNVLEAKSRQLAYCIVQASQYYRAADAVTVDTSPLLYFYGMLSLAKALVVANDSQVLLDGVRFHGLKMDRSTPPVSLEALGARIDKRRDRGVFSYLTKVVQGFEYPQGAVLTLKDVLSISPELFEMYERYFGEKARCVGCYMTRLHSTNPYRIEICALANAPEDVTARIPELGTDFSLRQNQGATCVYQWFTSKETVSGPPTGFWEYSPPTGGRYLVGALPFTVESKEKTHWIHPALTDYITMFILSNCVQYKQDLWVSVVQGRETGVLGLVDLIVSIAKHRFPNLILNSLFGETFIYDARRPNAAGLAINPAWPPGATLD